MSADNAMKNTDTKAREEFSLNDDRRVKTLSPGALVTKRFLRNRVAVTGLIILAFMFIFSFIGGMVTPYREDQLFYRTEYQNKQYAGVTENTELRYSSEGKFPSLAQAQFVLAQIKHQDTFTVKDVEYRIEQEGEELYAIYEGDELVAIATYSIVSSSTGTDKVPFHLQHEILKAISEGKDGFTYEDGNYELDEDGTVFKDGEEIAYASRYIVQPIMGDVFLTRSFKDELVTAIEARRRTTRSATTRRRRAGPSCRASRRGSLTSTARRARSTCSERTATAWIC